MTNLPRHTALIIALLLAVGLSIGHAQRRPDPRQASSGGPLMPEQAGYDVKAYDLSLLINPTEQSIKGELTAHALVVHPIDWFVLDLDNALAVDSVALIVPQRKTEQKLDFKHKDGQLWIAFPNTKQPGDNIRVRISYGGKPRIAPRPPWVGGFVWSKTLSGEPWVGVACQGEGADLWFPVKDHPSDKPETTSLHFTVPEPLVAASNGRLQSVVKNQDGTQTFNWFVSSPISNYNITLNVAPYKTVEDSYQSRSGENVPIMFWVLPPDYDKATVLVKHIKDYLRFFEEYLGPFPFRSEKIGIAQTRYLGMEHQTIIAYGNNFRYDANGFDWLMFHELGHEWWGNLVTANDWRDFWIHEGFQSFMDTLYFEKLHGKEAYFQGMSDRMKRLRNMQPVAPRESRTTKQMYWAAPDYLTPDQDIYEKGAVILHTLRYLIGDKAFFTALRRMAYPDSQMEKITNGRQVRFATTDEFLHIAEAASGMELDWFFEVYLRQPELPKLLTERNNNQLTMRWQVPANLPFPMPVEVRKGSLTKRLEMPPGSGSVPIESGESVSIDPHNWILKAQ
jgi:aminopeptidase N